MQNLEFEPQAFDDLTYWVQRDRKKARRILQLLDAVRRDPSVSLPKIGRHFWVPYSLLLTSYFLLPTSYSLLPTP